MGSGVRKSCLLYIQNTSRIQPLLTTSIATPLAQENARLVSLLPLTGMPTLMYLNAAASTIHSKTQVRLCCSSAQKPTVAPIFLRCKIQTPTWAARAPHICFPLPLQPHTSASSAPATLASLLSCEHSQHPPLAGSSPSQMPLPGKLSSDTHTRSPLISFKSVLKYSLLHKTYLNLPV